MKPEYTEEQQKEVRRIISSLNLCPCGSGTEYEIIKSIFDKADSWEAGQEVNFYEAMGNAPSDWVQLVVKFLDGHDLLEHGTSVGFCWTTKKGKILQKFMQDFGMDYDLWPEWTFSETL